MKKTSLQLFSLYSSLPLTLNTGRSTSPSLEWIARRVPMRSMFR